jgi:hypothetical protein
MSDRRTLAYWIPPVALDIASAIRGRIRYRDLRHTLPRNSALRDAHSGETVYVVANGPSLLNFGPKNLFGQKVIVMNHFELADWKSEVEIVAHCLGEPFDSPAWEDPTSSICGTDARSYWLHISAILDPAVSRCAESKPLHFAQAIIKPGLWGGGRIDLSRPTLGYQTTAQLAISVALHMGFSTIYLVGFNHDWLCTRGHSPHFYADDADVPPADLSRFTYAQMIGISARMWAYYHALERSARSTGARVINLSEPSFLDVFPTGPAPLATASQEGLTP